MEAMAEAKSHPDLVSVAEGAGPHGRAEAEDSILAAARAGDGEAFARLVRPHLSLLYGVALRTCGNPALAEDAVQDALLAAYTGLARYRPGSSWRAFLVAIAYRKAFTARRSEQRRRAREEVARPLPAASAEEETCAGHLAVRVEKALARLPRKRRQAAVLRLEAGLSYAEIGQTLKSSENSARVLVHLALKELRRELGEPAGPATAPRVKGGRQDE